MSLLFKFSSGRMGINLNYTRMEIDLSSIIISAIVWLFFIIPIAYDQWKKRKS